METGGERVPFTADFLLDKICLPMVAVILSIVFGRFLWRVMFFGTGINVEKDLRDRMFGNARFLSREYYQVHKVGDLMSLFTNDLDTVQECFAWGFMMFFDALLLGGLSIGKMFRMNAGLTLLSLIPMGLLLCCATVLGKYMMKKWDVRQAAFSKLSDFAQESFSGVAVIKAFVKESRELMAFGKLNRENEKANVAHTRASVLMRVLVGLFVESVICIILGYGGYLVYKKVFNAGLLMEFIGYFSATVWPIMAVSELIDMTSRGKASLNRISKLLDAETAVKDRDGPHRRRVAGIKTERKRSQGKGRSLSVIGFRRANRRQFVRNQKIFEEKEGRNPPQKYPMRLGIGVKEENLIRLPFSPRRGGERTVLRRIIGQGRKGGGFEPQKTDRLLGEPVGGLGKERGERGKAVRFPPAPGPAGL